MRGNRASFYLQTLDAELANFAGAVQVTSYTDRRWTCSIEIVPQTNADIMEWSLVLAQLALKENVAAIVPPHCTGPSTGYAGSGPSVNGASQTGTSLNVNGLSGSQPILSRGDFLSFDTTTAGGYTNRQLVQVTSDVSSSSGSATFPLSYPIRVSPANGASVEIFSPSAFFTLSQPKGGLDRLSLPRFGTFTIEALERIWKS